MSVDLSKIGAGGFPPDMNCPVCILIPAVCHLVRWKEISRNIKHIGWAGECEWCGAKYMITLTALTPGEQRPLTPAREGEPD